MEQTRLLQIEWQLVVACLQTIKASVLHHITTTPPHLQLQLNMAQVGNWIVRRYATSCKCRQKTNILYFNHIIYALYAYELQTLPLAYVLLYSICHAIKATLHTSMLHRAVTSMFSLTQCLLPLITTMNKSTLLTQQSNGVLQSAKSSTV